MFAQNQSLTEDYFQSFQMKHSFDRGRGFQSFNESCDAFSWARIFAVAPKLRTDACHGEFTMDSFDENETLTYHSALVILFTLSIAFEIMHSYRTAR